MQYTDAHIHLFSSPQQNEFRGWCRTSKVGGQLDGYNITSKSLSLCTNTLSSSFGPKRTHHDLLHPDRHSELLCCKASEGIHEGMHKREPIITPGSSISMPGGEYGLSQIELQRVVLHDLGLAQVIFTYLTVARTVLTSAIPDF